MLLKWRLNFIEKTCILRKSNGNRIVLCPSSSERNGLNNGQYIESNYRERERLSNSMAIKKDNYFITNLNMKNE